MDLYSPSNCMDAKKIYKTIDSASDKAKEELKRMGLTKGLTQKELLSLIMSTSDQVYEEFANAGVFGPLITHRDLIELCSGTDPSGVANSLAALSIDNLVEDDDDDAPQLTTHANISFGNAVINIYSDGGCAVVTADFAKHNKFEYRRACDIIEEWMHKAKTEEFENKMLTLSIFPIPLNGKFAMLFQGLVFAQGTVVDEQTTRLILAFDANSSQQVIDADINLEELQKQVETELIRIAEANKIAELKERELLKQAQESNMSEEFIEATFSPSYLRSTDDEGYDVDAVVDRYGDYFDDDEDDHDSVSGLYSEDIKYANENMSEKTRDNEWMRISKD